MISTGKYIEMMEKKGWKLLHDSTSLQKKDLRIYINGWITKVYNWGKPSDRKIFEGVIKTEQQFDNLMQILE